MGRVGQIGAQCKFPFTFKYLGMTFGPYDACADYFGTLYCATEVDNNGNALKYGVCDPNCGLYGKESNTTLLGRRIQSRLPGFRFLTTIDIIIKWQKY